ncbi:MAG: phosphatidylglycerol lysyltransferase domain-containing protein [Candidatus Omnitrophica bacterium]|nr:phosphatidylglycerol lysyltransferase domain-containing protein [Candidatus Omnitrophota bacterium]
MNLRQLSLKDKAVFDKYLSTKPYQLSAYTFAGIFIWKSLYRISWSVIEENLCVFFQDKLGCFMNLDPQGKNKSAALIKKCFTIMDFLNKNSSFSRIENIEEGALDFYRALGYNCVYKSSEYLCSSSDLAALRGNAFKSKRSVYNYFVKNYPHRYSPLLNKDKAECLRLYKKWMLERKAHTSDAIYLGMLKDNLLSQKIALADYQRLGLVGRKVTVKDKIVAYTLGCEIAPDTFCILFETTDLDIKGAAQFIFREFCREMARYKYINIMDDLGLQSLAKVKLSYKPIKLIPAYIVQRYA